MSNKNSTAKIEANNRYNRKSYDNVTIALPKGRKQTVEAHAKSKNLSVNALVNTLLRSDIGLSESEWKQKG
jgi:hypothetical protein